VQAPRIGEISGCCMGNGGTSECNWLGSNGLNENSLNKLINYINVIINYKMFSYHKFIRKTNKSEIC